MERKKKKKREKDSNFQSENLSQQFCQYKGKKGVFIEKKRDHSFKFGDLKLKVKQENVCEVIGPYVCIKS